MNLSQQDLNVRLQKTGCCVGQEAKRLAQYYLYGSECAEEQLQKVTILNAYLDILSCYQVENTTSTNWVYFLDFTDLLDYYFGTTNTIKIIIGDQIVLDYVAPVEYTLCGLVTYMCGLIEANPNIISAVPTCDGKNVSMTITAACNMTPASATVYKEYDGYPNDSELYNVPTFTVQSGKCPNNGEDNCVTEEQINKIIENISVMCKDCFKPAGFAYYNK